MSTLVCVNTSSGGLELWEKVADGEWILAAGHFDHYLVDAIGTGIHVSFAPIWIRLAAGPIDNGREVLGEL
jgi:hypothetical protein